MKKTLFILIPVLLLATKVNAQITLSNLTVMLSAPNVSQGANQQSGLTVACQITTPIDKAHIVLMIGSEQDKQDAGLVNGVLYKKEETFTAIPNSIQYTSGNLVVNMPTGANFFGTAKYITLYLTNEQGQKISNVMYYSL